ncbi:TonB-dependent receptor domain-containing protein [Cellvibrio japonicus]|uniref:Putative TonB-dependent receptor n=1 Tax=Cellvibrio japonicus (strain Ueda107) TaxID=498211 RepID=B3PB97_CELJU|nr:TonB-dependent receptor [Cellvibrio japonicus]ACE83407.1 putative TonB-dependent receptor [Cellvibrio japonicus Ueda107]QEI11682.1 TonB-dependent receptor plug domain-containing protein [Cellvibrio japonicus]QEI15256.1 TonB-dependent receptor plug domain-containing protein [Cellvibrio japonicus]QEI18836.1 TonB-dependent receptor plug domain-containing protein [Cellvibrio japonicus]
MYKAITFKKKLLATAVASVAISGVSSIAYAQSNAVEEVVVTGIKSSLERSVDIKRTSSQIVEAITADDIGKMPDQNVADSLQRVPGVQIDRAGGEGTKVRIRGLGNNLTLLNGEAFVSGMEYYQAGEGRTEFDGSLEGVPSELLGGVEVIKTARASDIEGAVGGIVNLKTRSPLTLKEPVIAGNIKADIGDVSDDAQPSATLVLGNSWDNFGAIFSISAAKKTVQVDEAQNLNRNSFGWHGTDVDLTGSGTVGDDNQWYVVPGMQYETDKQFERERVGTSLALAWAPSDNSEITLDWFHSSLDIDDRSYSMKYTLNTDGGALLQNMPYTIDRNGVITSGSFSTSGENNSYRDITEITTDNLKLGFKVDASEQWSFDGALSYASADLKKDAAFADARYQPYSVRRLVDDAWEGSAPNISSTVGQGDRYISISQGSSGTPNWSLSPNAYAALQDPESFLYKSNWAYGDRSTNDSFALALNATYNIEFGDVKNIKFGIRQSNNEVDFVEGHYQVDLSCSNPYDPSSGTLATDGSVQGVGACIPDGHNLGDVDGDGISDNQLWGPTTRYVDANIDNPLYGSLTSNGSDLGFLLTGINASRWDGTSPGIIPWHTFVDNPTTGAVGKPGYYVRLNDFFPSGGAISSGLFVDPSKMSNPAAWLSSMAAGAPTRWYEDKVQSWNVDRDVTAIYTEANLEGDTVPYTLNVGVRVVRTETTTTGGQTTPDDIYSGTDSWNGPVLVQGTFSVKKTYTDILPSLNFSLDTADNQKVRFAMARVMSQPNAQDLGHGANYNFTRNDARGGYEFVNGTVGNPRLDPFRATQADLSYEVYLDSLSYLSVGTFIKAVDSFPAGISTPTEVADSTNEGSTVGQVNSTINGSGGIVKGFEIAYQMGFDNGLGFAVNYTYSDSKTDLESETNKALPLPGVSENTFNIVGFYEMDRIQARIAYTWRDEYLSPDYTLEQIAGVDAADGTVLKPISQFASFYDAYGQLDLSLSYDVTENFALTAEGINLTSEEQRRYIEYTNFFRSNTAAERRFVLGAKYKF